MSRHLVTSALPYASGVKHLGNLVGSLLPADVHARFLRAEGHDVRFVCGTDEHGTPAELAAAAAGAPVDRFCAELHALQAAQYRALGLSFDHFGRTSAAGTRAVAVEVYLALRDRGLVDIRTIEQLWSPTEGRFLPDRYVHGTCPRCGDPDARGDACDACGALLDPTELVDPRSAISGARDLGLRASTHAFLKLSALAEVARGWVEAHADAWGPLPLAVARAWLAEGLRDRCISRDLAWGTPVPDLPGKVFWCWFDAPLGYVGLTRDLDPEGWSAWWDPDARDLTITQFLGKDNLPFHTVWLPSILQAVGGLRSPDRLCGLHWLSWYGQRFSTSANRGVFIDQALQLFPADVWRWGLLAQIPEAADARFTWDTFAQVVNKDLVGQLGNLVHRLQALFARVGGHVPAGGAPGPEERALAADTAAALTALADAHHALRFRGVIEALRALARIGNRYLDRRAPWRALHDDPLGAAVSLRTAAEHLHTLAVAVAPVVPTAAEQIGAFLGLDPTTEPIVSPLAAARPPLAGRPITPCPPLFAPIVPPAG